MSKVTIPLSEVKTGYHLFGNKGSVWSNEAHLSKGNAPTTLCGVPMLSNNWARIEGMTEIGCPDCIAIYKEQNPNL